MIDLSNDKSKETAVANFKGLLTHPGWVMFEEIVKANIEVVKEAILKGINDETIEDVKRLRDRLAVHEEIINTPKAMIDKLTPKEPIEIPDDDPFYKKVESEDKKV